MIIVFWVYIFLTRADIAIVTGSARHEDKSRRTKHTFEPPPKNPDIQNSSPGSQIQIELFKLLVQTSELQVWNPISGLCLNNENIENRHTHESI